MLGAPGISGGLMLVWAASRILFFQGYSQGPATRYAKGGAVHHLAQLGMWFVNGALVLAAFGISDKMASFLW